LRVLEQLRCCIVIATMRKMTKIELINRIDSSFIDEKAGQQLEEMLAEARDLLSVSPQQMSAECGTPTQ